MSRKLCKLESPEENPQTYLKGFEKYGVPSTEQGINEKTLKDS